MATNEDRDKKKKDKPRNLTEEYQQSRELQKQAQAITRKQMVTEGEGDNARNVRFEAYKDIGGDRMYRKFERGSIVETFDQSEMEQFVEENKGVLNMESEDKALADEESRSTARISNRRSTVNNSQVTPALSATDFIGTDGFIPESFTVIENGVPVTRTFLIR